MIYLYIKAKYIRVLKRTYPFSASKSTKEKQIKSKEVKSFFLSALEKSTYNIANKGGKNRCILLNTI
jgi:hypothetical protein